MAYTSKGCLSMLFLAFMNASYLSHVADNTLNICLKQPDVKISVYGLNSANLTWGPEVTAETVKFDVCYNFSYQFLDKTTWLTETLIENYRVINLRLHPGFTASVSNALCEDNIIILESKRTEIVYLAPYVYISNVSCAIYNLTNLNCTWDLKKDAPEDANYSFGLRLRSRCLACKQYLKKHGKNNGCHMKDLLSTYQHENLHYKIRIQFFNHLYNFTKTFRTEMIEILNPPVNISVSSVNGNINFSWYTPPSVKPTPTYCFQYQIKVIETQTNILFKDIPDIEMEEYTFSDLDKDKKYSLQIRARKNHCAKSKYWGEWSKPVYIGKDTQVFPVWTIILIIAIVSALLVILVVLLFKRYMKILFMTAIPDPSKKIKLWLTSNDNSSERCIATHDEQLVPITEIEIVTTSRD
ncbi:interleukin-5 receptor subunit alpha-like [Pseudophryne corroboree]|uniref:interleukin-5 receptor subunit alpha-like n=1 Tax=Pseudophryne corroboree TaxID=495146 RepID=UPI003081D884